MRRTYNSKLIMNGNQFQGFNLGADYCAEHEWGIKGLADAFGLCHPDKYNEVVGIDRFKAHRIPDFMRVLTFQSRNVKYISIIVSDNKWYNRESDAEMKRFAASPLIRSDGEFTNAAWDEHSFTITVPFEKRAYIYALKKAIEEMQVAVFLWGSDNPFGRAGLCIMLLDAVPNSLKNDMSESHNEEIRLNKAVEKTGIVDILKKAGKRWYALRAAWAKDMDDSNGTKYPVVFFLNPEEQNKYNFGWFTVEELKEWAKDKGPIVKK